VSFRGFRGDAGFEVLVDFFSAQDEARRNTAWLVLLFSLAVVSIVVLLYLAVVFLVSYSDTARMAAPIQWWQPRVFYIVAGLTSGVILLGSLFKTLDLARGGGASVAESLGGRLVQRETRDGLKRRLLNVVDEMAIASGLPVPKVYILEQEGSINAFAAGYDVQSAVVAVTRGCLERLSRDELQGVVAHEFSHVFNGDMRINLRLIGILHGILLLALAGRVLLRGGGRSRSRSSGGIVAVGLALFVAGYAGLFFGRVLKAAVSRQREYLADAAAVQYTRNPAGLAGALKKIGGFADNLIVHPRAEEASHMFFATGVVSHLNLLATHPPLELRIKRLEPMFVTAKAQPAAKTLAAAGAMLAGLAGGEAMRVSPSGVSRSVGNSDERHLGYAHALLDAVPERIMADVHDAQRARAVVYALLAGSLDDMSVNLPRLLQGEGEENIALAAGHVLGLASVNRAVRLPLLELAIAAIAEEGAGMGETLLSNCRALVEADRRVTVFEFAVLSLLEHALGIDTGPALPRQRPALAEIARDCDLVFSLLAHSGHHDPEAAAGAFAAAHALMGLEGEGEFSARKAIRLPPFAEALSRLNTLKYRFKARVIEACVAAVAADGRVTLAEAELLRAIGARLDCPIPPLLPGTL
jgi:Zn-dependent protease with chaperone function